ncbi:MAG: type II secretion system protein [Alteromonadaceae bacterium]|jgi:tight adherence protein B|uniref:type II secretion system F family protein n=1 Tax=Marinobacter shengliensis TaxID=1389223 RepID=UPI000C0A0702|nr:type II secretion system F family protein [Marinobacter shengliensis]MAL98289.1 type II secretion system protein [Alteromonadaceae bacterium]BEH15244.1 type II secretion system protein F [Marinobacter shengliensis]|tara:strand:- start:1011 stop:1925 length:915 start_codon:yes stop_codon:yes gene_type:complete
MNAQVAWFLSMLIGTGALIIILSQLVVSRLMLGSSIKKRVRNRLAREATVEEKASIIDLGPLQNLMLRAGIKVSPGKVIFLAMVALTAIALTYLYRGVVEVLVLIFFILTALVTLWRVKFEKQRRKIYEELPGILDSMLRSISVGRSVEQSIVMAFADASPVFDPMVFRLRNAVAQGRDYTSVLDAFAAFYQVPAFTQVAIALRTSSRFGSSVRPILFEVSRAIRSQQELRREFLAATAETRFTAVVFALLPPALAVYMVVLNEQFSEKLLESDVGHTLLMISGGLQLLGILMIWNLIRGVGRA